jgi:hypothetical protein
MPVRKLPVVCLDPSEAARTCTLRVRRMTLGCLAVVLWVAVHLVRALLCTLCGHGCAQFVNVCACACMCVHVLRGANLLLLFSGRVFSPACAQVKIIKNDVLLTTPFITLSVDSFNERGVLGIAFHPNFATNNFVYIW